jgi:Protein of unknown function (DUF1453)
MGPHANPAATLLPILFIGLVLFLRIRRMRGTRRLRLETLWIIPAIFLLLAVLVLYETPPHGIGWIVAAAALIGGGFLGWHRGRSMRISVDPASGTLNQTASPLTFILLIGLIAIRFGVRYWAAYGGAAPASVTLITDAFVLLALGIFSVQRLEMFLRARRLLDEARAGPVAG